MFVLDKGLELLPDEPKNLNLAFIPTATNLYKNKSWLYKDRDRLIAMEFIVRDVDIEDKTREDLEKELDVIYVSGGNTFYLLEKVRASGFDEIVKKLIDKGVVYIGSSAGAALVCLTIEPIMGMDDPEVVPSLTSYERLGIVDYLVLPHYGDEDYKKYYAAMLKKWENKGYELRLLTNNQALIVNGDVSKIVDG